MSRGGVRGPKAGPAHRLGVHSYDDWDDHRQLFRERFRGCYLSEVVDITWQWCRFGEMRPEELYAVVRLREAVFVVEQNCPYPDADGRDPRAWHLLGWQEMQKERVLAAYARVFEPGVRYTEASIGRVVTAQAVRGTGIGRELMAEALRRVDALAPGEKIKLAAQRRLEEFYAGFGFTTVSAPYEEDGIIHIDMVR